MRLLPASTNCPPSTRTASAPVEGGGGGGLDPVVRLNELAVNEALLGLSRPIAPVVASAGIVTRTCASETTVNVASCALPAHAWVRPVKPEPLSVTTVPAGPDVGAKSWMYGVASALAALLPVMVTVAVLGAP